MPRKKTEEKKRNAKGLNSVTRCTVTRDGKAYTYYRARFYVTDSTTGLKVQKECTASSQQEAIDKMNAIKNQIATGTYQTATVNYSLDEWLTLWGKTFLSGVKPRTKQTYVDDLKVHVQSTKLAKVQLTKLTSLQIQQLYNSLTNKRTGEKLGAKTVLNVHRALRQALDKAVKLGYIAVNPAANVELPKVTPAVIKPLDDTDIANFLQASQGSQYHDLFMVALFTGMRKGEVCGLSWDSVDFKTGLITVSQQLQQVKGQGNTYIILPTKNSKSRVIRPASSIMTLLHSVKLKQYQEMLAAGSDNWQNKWNLVFTQKDGSNISPQSAYLEFKQIANKIGRPDARFHDLRHSYAVQSIRNGDDLKTLQHTLGHSSAGFTLQVYAHCTDAMLRESAERMEKFIKSQSVKIG